MVPNVDLVLSVAEERTRDIYRRAEVNRLLRDAGLSQTRRPCYRTGRLFSLVGHTLVAVGRWLESSDVPPIAPGAELTRTEKARPNH